MKKIIFCDDIQSGKEQGRIGFVCAAVARRSAAAVAVVALTFGRKKQKQTKMRLIKFLKFFYA